MIMALFWAGLLVVKLIGPMLGEGAPRRGPRTRLLVVLGLLIVAGFLLDQVIHGRLL